MILPSQLKDIAPYVTSAHLALYTTPLNRAMEKYGINTRLRIAAFIANIMHESGSLQYVKEIASGEAYEDRIDLGNSQEGDGKKYKGRGLIQVTGRFNYAELTKEFDIDFISHPQLLEQPDYAALASAWWWKKHGCNELADKGKFIDIVRVINGGTNGLTERSMFYNKALKVII